MQTIDQLTASGLPTDTRSHATPTTMPTPSLHTLDAFWRRMLGMFGHTWASQYGDHPSGTTAETWAQALAGVSPPMIAIGLRACLAEGKEFPPSAPRFRGMCMGIPSFATVKFESTKPDAERSPFTRAVWLHLDGYAYRQASARDGDRMLRDAYELASEQVMRGTKLPEPAAGELEAPSDAKPNVNPDPEARKALAERMRRETFEPGEFELLTQPSAEEIAKAEAELETREPTQTEQHIDHLRGLYGSTLLTSTMRSE